MLYDGQSQFVELLAVGGGRCPAGMLPAHLSASQDNWEPLVVLTIRPMPCDSFMPHNLSITKAQAQRLLEDVKWVLEHDPILTGSIHEE